MYDNLNEKKLNEICESGKRSIAILKDIITEQNKKNKELQEHIEKLNKELAKATSNKDSAEKVVEGKDEKRFYLMHNSHGYFVYDKGYANYGATNGVLGGDYCEEKDFLKDVVDKLNEKVSWDDKRDLSKPSELAKILLEDGEGVLASSLLIRRILEDILCGL